MTKEQIKIIESASAILDEEKYSSAYYTRQTYFLSQADKYLKDVLEFIHKREEQP